MGELRLGARRITDYGTYYKGSVETEDRVIKVAWREPSRQGRAGGVAYVMANGWLGAKSSMRLPAHEAARAGHFAVTFGYTNTGTVAALEQNAIDLAAVIDSVPQDYKRRVMALSMGGRVTTKALTKIGSQVESATLIATAGYTSRDPSKLEVVQHFGEVVPETVGFAVKHPVQALYMGATTVHHCATRGRAVIGEIGELIHGNEHDTLRSIKAGPNAPYMRLSYGDGDRLIPAWAYEESIPGLPFDDVEKYHGGHTAAVYDPEISREIFRRDSQLPSPSPLDYELIMAAA